MTNETHCLSPVMPGLLGNHLSAVMPGFMPGIHVFSYDF
jgi:hypothetical protein